MKNNLGGMFVALLVILSLFAFSGAGTSTQVSSPTDSQLTNHHKELQFRLAPGQSFTFSLPKKQYPVRIEVSTSNVPIAFMGTTTNLGPLFHSAVASFDSAAGIANIVGNNSLCPGQDSCSAFSCFNLPEPNFFAGQTCLVLSVDTHNGNVTASIITTRSDFVIATNQISFRVNMWY